MNRDVAMERIRGESDPWDFLIIGGGATGLGAAVDAAARGYRTLLVEQHDFARGTSSRSTKLVHGGVRYLRQGNISLVLEALHERGLLVQNAPHLVHPLMFVVPLYSWWEGPFYGIGLKLYDQLAGKLGLNPSRFLSREETVRRIPTIEQQGLLGGISYYDGQFDDARLAISLAQTVFDFGGVAVNYVGVVGLIKENGLVVGAAVQDTLDGTEWEIRARVVINATGVFCDTVRKMDDADAPRIVAPSQGTHIVLPQSFLPGDTAIMVPQTSDGRVLFAVPWHERVVVGTTDVGVETADPEPLPKEEEIDFILSTSARYLHKAPERSDVLSVFAGLRPLVRAAQNVPGGDEKQTAALSRDHTILIAPSGLITITGGKWTTYRKMAQDVIDQAETVAGFERRPSRTETLRIHGATSFSIAEEHGQIPPLATERIYGTDAPALRDLTRQHPVLAKRLHPDLPYIGAEIVWAARAEMAQTVEDALARRTRALILGAKASVEVAPVVARLMAQELGRGTEWESRSVADFTRLADGYRLT